MIGDGAPGRPLRRQGRARRYFSSSSGGRTVSAAEASGTPVPYLVSVPIRTTRSRRTTTGARSLFDAAAAAKALKLAGPLLDLHADRRAVGPRRDRDRGRPDDAVDADRHRRPRWRSACARRGSRSAGSRSTPPPSPVVYGGRRTLTGIARGARRASTLEAKTPGGAWQTVAAVTPDPIGRFTVASRPGSDDAVPARRRRRAGGLVQVAVAPLVRAAVRGGAVTGTVSPAVAGAAVQLQRLDGTAWTTVAPATVDPPAGSRFAPRRRRARTACGAPREQVSPRASRRPCSCSP